MYNKALSVKDRVFKTMAITNSWSLVAFAKLKGNPTVAPAKEFTNKETGETFFASSVWFRNPQTNEVTFCNFAKSLGSLSPKEIVERKEFLQVVQDEEGKFTLCESKFGSVDLF